MGQRIKIVYICLLLSFSCFQLNAEEIVLITNKNTQLKNVSLDNIKKIYMGRPSDIEGDPVHPVMLSMSHSDTKVFIQDYLKMTLFEFDQYWLEKELSGQENTPKNFYSSDKLIEFIKHNKGYIAYIGKNSVKKNGLKVIPLKL